MPAHYRGPLYYRILTRAAAGVSPPLSEMITFEDPALGERLARVNPLHSAVRAARGLCDERGDLLPDLRQPIRARLKANARKRTSRQRPALLGGSSGLSSWPPARLHGRYRQPL